MSKSRILLLLITLLAFFLRFYLLGSIPPGLSNDEADIGYDAYSILATGRDQWGKFLPVTSFEGFGDYRLPLYTYLILPSVKLLGLNALSVRLPSAIFGTISVLLLYIFCKKIFERQSDNFAQAVSLVSAFLLAVSPWSIGLSRIGIESNVAITFLLSALILLLYGLKHPKLLLISSAFFALTVYTYTSYTLFTVLVLAVCFIFYRNELLKHMKWLVVSVVIFFLLISPLLFLKSAAGVRASQISLVHNQVSIGLLADLNDRRGSCVAVFPDLLCKVVDNKAAVFTDTFIKNYINHFSPGFLYLTGTRTQFSILPERGLMYTLEILFLLAGVLYAVRQKSRKTFFIIVLLLASFIPDSITSDGHFSRASCAMPFLFALEAVGLVFIFQLLTKTGKFLSLSLKTVLCVIFAFSILSFTVSYFSYFPKYYSNFSQYGYEQWAQKLFEKKSAYDRIYLSRYGNDTKQYIYYLFYTKYPPSRFQEKKDISISTSAGGWLSIDRIGNFYFVDRIPSELQLTKMSDKKVLLVTHPTELPEGKFLLNLESVKDKNGNSVFVFVDGNKLLDYYKSQKQEADL